MARNINLEAQLGRRLKLRDLHVFFSVVQCGSMAKAAAQLGVSHPTVSEVIAGLEHTFGVRLLDRLPHGVEATKYGAALFKRTAAVFDELRQSSRDMDFLADPAIGELRIGCPESIIATVLPPFIEYFAKRYPGVIVHVHEVPSPAIRHPGLRDRKYDLVFLRQHPAPSSDPTTGDLSLDYLFDDPLIIAAGLHSPWSRRRTVDLAELTDVLWILPHPDSWNYLRVAEAFRERGLDMPKVSVFGFSMHLVNHFVANGPFVTAHPRSVARFCSLKVLPVKLPIRPWQVAIATLNNRTLSPVVERFIECAREVAKALVGTSEGRTAHRRKPNVSYGS